MQMILPFVATKRVPKTRVRSLAGATSKPQAEEGDARVWNEKGNQLLRAGNHEEAIRAYNIAIKHDRRFGWA